MPRAIWTGSIAFGLVQVPVELFSATREHRPRFHQLSKKSKQRVHHKRVTADSDQALDVGDMVKGFEVSRGRHVVISDAVRRIPGMDATLKELKMEAAPFTAALKGLNGPVTLHRLTLPARR